MYQPVVVAAGLAPTGHREGGPHPHPEQPEAFVDALPSAIAPGWSATVRDYPTAKERSGTGRIDRISAFAQYDDPSRRPCLARPVLVHISLERKVDEMSTTVKVRNGLRLTLW